MTSRDLTQTQALLVRRLPDVRSRRVIFLSHCILNENTRYLGGAGRAGCVREIAQQCMDQDLGMVQMPCPEERVWGGVLKRYLLAAYGLKYRHAITFRIRSVLLPLALLYTRLRYRWLADRVARQIDDYVASGFLVAGVVGIDGSPTCGLRATIDMGRCDTILCTEARAMTSGTINAALRARSVPGAGMFTRELQRHLRRRGVIVPFLAHDLWAEIDGRSASPWLFSSLGQDAGGQDSE